MVEVLKGPAEAVDVPSRAEFDSLVARVDALENAPPPPTASSPSTLPLIWSHDFASSPDWQATEFGVTAENNAPAPV